MYKRFYAAIILSAVLLIGCGHDHSHEGHSHEAETSEHDSHAHDSHGEQGLIKFSEKQAEMAGLQLEKVSLGDFSEVIRVSGQVSAAQGDEAAVVARSSGVVTFVRDHLSDGSEVRNGEILARISAAGIAGGDVIQLNKLALEQARAAYERAARLVKDSIISQKDYEQARLDYEQTRLTAGEKADNKQVPLNNVTSPLKGYIKNVLVKQGEYVEAGTVIATVTKSCNLQLRAEVPEKYFASLNNVRSANFKMGYDNVARSLDELGGHLVAVGRTADEGSAYIPVTFEFNNQGSVVPGSFADIWLIMQSRQNVLSIPVSALTEAQGVYYAYIRHEHEDELTFERRELRLGASDGRRIEVISGINVGEEVVINGVSQVKMAAFSGEIPHGHSH